MTDNLMTQITLDCLLNKEQYNKCNNNINSNNNSRKDKKFYKKRIYNLTKEYLIFFQMLDALLSNIYIHVFNILGQSIEMISYNPIIKILPNR